MTDLRNVIVFSVGERSFAIEIRWIREVATLGFVTIVPSAPPALCGVCNWHGQILAVVDLKGACYASSPRQGDGALIIDVANTLLAVRLEKILRVATLALVDGSLQDGTAAVIELLEPEAVYKALQMEIERVGESQVGRNASPRWNEPADDGERGRSERGPGMERTSERAERGLGRG